jgi:membrane protease YdiL (CAAX protease family)
MSGLLVLVFALTFGFQFGAIYLLPESLLQMALVALGGIAPGVVALILNRGIPRGEGGRPGLAALGAVAIPLAVALAASVAGGGVALRPQTPDPTTLYLVLFAPFFEELCWRGTLQRRWEEALRRRTGRPRLHTVPLVSLLVGVIWGLWHLPMSWDGGLVPFLLFVAGTTITSLWIGVLYELGGRRVWVAMLAHAAINVRLFDVPDAPLARIAGVAVSLTFAGLATIAMPKRWD